LQCFEATVNRLVAGSNPARGAKLTKGCAENPISQNSANNPRPANRRRQQAVKFVYRGVWQRRESAAKPGLPGLAQSIARWVN
jgi:hypothetical protein